MTNSENPSGNNLPEGDIENISFKGELFRKLTHICALSIPIIYYFAGSIVILVLLSSALALALSIETVRFYGGDKSRKFIQRCFGIMIRPHEKIGFTGATYILTSSIITILIFDKVIAILAISYIVVGDTAGAIVGRRWGRIRYMNKTLEGSLSFFASCCLISLIVPGIPLWIKIFGALSAAVVEAFTVFIDDNLTVPLISGALMQLMLK